MNKNQKNILIGGLLALVLIMAVGYAAFATQLNIGGTAETTTTWNIRITNIRTVDLTSINGTALTNNGAYDVQAPTYDNTNGLTATFQTGLTSPGDTRVYEVEVSNLGSLDADITKVLTNNSNNPAIEFTYDGVSSTSVLTNAGAYTKSSLSTTEPFSLPATTGNVKYVYVTVKYSESVQGQPTSTTGSMTLTLNAVQEGNSSSGGSGGSGTEPFTGTIYRWNSTVAQYGSSIVPVSGTKYVITDGNQVAPVGPYNDQSECQTALEGFGSPAGYSCQEQTGTFGGVGEYTIDASTLNKTYYLKHDVEEDIITASYVCFVTDTEHCMKGGDNGASFEANTQIIKDYQTFYNLGAYSNGTGCAFNSVQSYCGGGGFSNVRALSDGNVNVNGSSSENCHVYDAGHSYCTE